MQETIQELVEIAQSLDEAGSEKLAAQLDELSNRLLDTKVAQYVGLQGYWVRNTRCWSNCYRQKRAQTPDKPAQQVWGECHSEYLESINNDGSGWDKYADTDEGLVKVAEQKSILDRQFNDLLNSKLEKGASVGHAVFEALEDLQTKHESDEVDIATALFELSSKAFVDQPQNAVKVAQVAEKIVRESQLWRGLRDSIGNMGNKARHSVDYNSHIGLIQARANHVARTMQGLRDAITNAQSYFASADVRDPGQMQKMEAARQVLQQAQTDTMQVDSILQNVHNNVTNVMRGVAQNQVNQFMQGGPQGGTPPQGGPPQGSPPAGPSPTSPAPANPAAYNAPTDSSPGTNFPASQIVGPSFNSNNLTTPTMIAPPNQRVGPTNIVGPGLNQVQKPRRRIDPHGGGYITPTGGANSKVKEGKSANPVAYNRSRALANNGGA